MSKDDAFTPSDELIELTDIVEQGTLPEVADEKSDSAFEQELDALFGEAGMDDAITAAKDVNPNEELAMPDMSDVDSLLGDMGTGDSDSFSASNAGNELEDADIESAPDVEGADELLADLIQGDGADDSSLPSGEALDQSASDSGGFDMDDSGLDDLDALLAEIGNDADIVNVPNSSPEQKKAPESIASQIAESGASTQAKKKPAEPVSPPDDLDALFAELEESDTIASAPPKSAPVSAASEGLSPETDDTLNELDALIDDIMSPADVAPAGAASAKASVVDAAPADAAPADAAPTEISPADAASADAAPVDAAPVDAAPAKSSLVDAPISSAMPEAGNTPSPTELAVEVEDIPAPASEVEASKQEPVVSEAKPAAKVSPAPTVLEDVAATQPSALQVPMDLDSLAKQLASGPLLAAMQTIVAQEVDKKLASQVGTLEKETAKSDELKVLVQELVSQQLETKIIELEANLEEKLNAGMDKATAAAAARIIREEIAALAEVL